MIFIKKKLIKQYLNPKTKFIYTKARSTTINKDVLGKFFIVYNGKKWLKTHVNNRYLLNKPVGRLKNMDTKKISIYKSKKKKKRRKKK